MIYRESLLKRNTEGFFEINNDAWNLLTDAQIARLAQWSLLLDQTVKQILDNFNPVLEASESAKGKDITLLGTLPTCGLFGAMTADGNTHT